MLYYINYDRSSQLQYGHHGQEKQDNFSKRGKCNSKWMASTSDIPHIQRIQILISVVVTSPLPGVSSLIFLYKSKKYNKSELLFEPFVHAQTDT